MGKIEKRLNFIETFFGVVNKKKEISIFFTGSINRWGGVKFIWALIVCHAGSFLHRERPFGSGERFVGKRRSRSECSEQ